MTSKKETSTSHHELSGSFQTLPSSSIFFCSCLFLLWVVTPGYLYYLPSQRFLYFSVSRNRLCIFPVCPNFMTTALPFDPPAQPAKLFFQIPLFHSMYTFW